MKIPTQIRAGDTIKWRDDPTTDVFGNEINSSTWTLTYYLRFNAASEASTVVGQAYQSGWEFTISAATSANFDAGQWFWQALATSGGEKLTIGAGQLTVDPSLSYTGSATAFDGRSQAQKDLEAVQGAIRTIINGGAVAEYWIGTGSGGRKLRRMALTELIALESKLKADVVREKRAAMMANGLGDPTKLYVRFRR